MENLLVDARARLLRGASCGRTSRRLVERERGAVDAPTLAGGHRTVTEDVPQVASAVRTRGLTARKQHREVGADQHSIASHRVREAGPARTRVELVLRTEQLGCAARAPVHAVRISCRVRVGAGARSLCARPTQHAVGLWPQARSPLSVRADHLGTRSGAPLEHATSLRSEPQTKGRSASIESVGVFRAMPVPTAPSFQSAPSRNSFAMTRPVSRTPSVRVKRASSVPVSSTSRQ